MPGLPLQTDAFILLKRPPADSFQSFTVFSATHGTLLAMQRVSRKSASTQVALDLFDEVSLSLESSNQGRTWFVKEAQLLHRPANLGRSYEALRFASALAGLIARNAVPEESRAAVAALLRQALASLADGARPEIVWCKSLFLFARDEGYPVKQDWFAMLSAADRDDAARLLNRPLAEQTASPAIVARLTRLLEDYLRNSTEILLD